MRGYISLHVLMGTLFSLFAVGFLAVPAEASAPASSYSSALRRYPYLTDVIGSYATINWATDRSKSAGGVRYGQVGSEACTAHYVAATKTAISINGVLAYQWKVQLNLVPGTQYCYRVYLGTSPTSETDLLGTDAAPAFMTQVPSGSTQSFSFLVFGDWGQVNSSGTNSSQAKLMALMAASGARFAVTTGDNGYPSGSQTNYGDLIQTGSNKSAVFGPSFWKVPGASLPIFLAQGNHGMSNSDTNHPALITWPQDRAVSTSGGRFVKETYCCLDGTTSKAYPSIWYAFDAGTARFYVLEAAWSDSNIGTASTEYKVDYDYHWATTTSQYKWLKADLAAHPAGLKFAFFHFPIYSDSSSETSDTFLQGSTKLEGLLKQNGVDIAFTGHAHIYERNRASTAGVINYVTGGGGATLGTLGTCTSLDAYAIKFTTSGKACGGAPVPTSANKVFHFLKVTVNGSNVTVTPINALGSSFDVMNYTFALNAKTIALPPPTDLAATTASGTQIDLSWSAPSASAGIRGYGIYRDGNLINTVDANTLTYSDMDLTPATGYSYQVDAFDGSGGHSDLSTSTAVTTVDTATYTFTAVADAYVSATASTTNNGLTNTLRTDGSPDFRSYLRFNVGDLSGTVTRATLRLYADSNSSAGYEVYSVPDQSWEEDSITYANAPATGALLGSSGSFVSNNWTSVDVTSLIAGEGIYDLALTTGGSNMNFNSRDANSNLPQLVIETSSSAGTTPTPSITPTTSPSTNTPTPTSTATATVTLTGTATPTSTNAPVATDTSTSTPVATDVPLATDTPVDAATPTFTPVATNVVAVDTPSATATPSPTETSPAASGSATVLTFTPEADARVAQSSPTTNFGASTNLRSDGGLRAAQTSYIRFTVSGTGGTIQNVKLRLFCTTNGAKNGPAVYLADNRWAEAGTDGITWSNQPALLSEALDNQDAVARNAWVEYDVSSLVTGDGTYTFALVADSTDGVTFSSREGSTPPELVVTFNP